MLKSVEETTLLTKLEELVQLAKKKKNVLEYKEIMDHLADLAAEALEASAEEVHLVAVALPGAGNKRN